MLHPLLKPLVNHCIFFFNATGLGKRTSAQLTFCLMLCLLSSTTSFAASDSKAFFAADYQVFFGDVQPVKTVLPTTHCLPEKITPRPLDFFLTSSPQNPSPALLNPPLGSDFSVSLQTKDAIQIQANQLIQDQVDRYELRGNTSLWQPGLLIFSPKISLNNRTQKVVLEPVLEQKQPNQLPREITVFDPTFTIQAKRAELMQNTNGTTLGMDFAKYQLYPSHAFGKAAHIKLDEFKQLADLTDADLSRCPADGGYGEGKKDWHLEFEQLTIDHAAQRVVGKHTVLKIRNIPVFYTPYFNYPLKERASGFLFPDIGSYSGLTSTQSSLYTKIPYFVDLAPNYDATLTPIAINQRGLALDAEFRHLTRINQQTYRTQIQASYLHDNLSAQQGIATINRAGNLEFSAPTAKRWRMNLDSHQNWGNGWHSQLQWHEVSDGSLYSDLPLDKRYEQAAEVRQNALLRYQSNQLNAYLQTLRYSPLQTARNLYQKQPEFALDWAFWQHQSWQASVQTQGTKFIADNAFEQLSPLAYEGQRFYAAPSVHYQKSTLFSDLKMTGTLHQRHYALNHTQNTSEFQQTLSIPEFSVLGRLIFERQFDNFWAGKVANQRQQLTHYSQTLEPKIQYVYIPYKDQQNIPLFDSSTRSLEFNNLFATNRFYGVDRIGDSHHLSYALSSKIYTPAGHQLLDIGIGQTAYLEDRKVTLSDDQLQTDTLSELYSKANLQLGKLRIENTAKIDHSSLKFIASNIRAHWQANTQQAIYLQYTLSKEGEVYENIAIGGFTPLNERTQLGLYSRYNKLTRRNENNQLLLRYQSCCWGLQLGIERSEYDGSLADTRVQFLFEFSGLSSQNSRNRLQDTLTERIY